MLAAALAALWALLAPSPARAAPPITVGQAVADGTVCPENIFLFNSATAPGGPTYVVPAGAWSLTSFSIDGGFAGGVAALVVGFLGPQGFEVVYSSAAQTLTPGVVNTFPASAIVLENDIIGLWMGSGSCALSTGAPQDVLLFIETSAPPLPGTIFTEAFGANGFTANIEVTLEPLALGPPPKLPPPPPRVAVCTKSPILRADGTVGNFAEILLSQYGTTDVSSPYYGAQPAIYVEGFGLMCQISEVVTYGGNPSQFRDSGVRVDGTGQRAPPGLEADWSAPYPYWVRAGPNAPPPPSTRPRSGPTGGKIPRAGIPLHSE